LIDEGEQSRSRGNALWYPYESVVIRHDVDRGWAP